MKDGGATGPGSGIAACIFDMDGLLLDSESLYRAAHQAAADALGYAMDDALHGSLIGMPRDRTEAILAASFGPVFDLARYDALFGRHFSRLCAGGIPLRPGVLDLLATLDARALPRAVATSTARALALAHLREAGILDRFDAVVTRDDVRRGKPDPETFLTAAARLRMAPGDCLALEDSHNGVRAASSAGMMTVMVPNLLAPTDAIRALCVGVRTSLVLLVRDLEEADQG